MRKERKETDREKEMHAIVNRGEAHRTYGGQNILMAESAELAKPENKCSDCEECMCLPQQHVVRRGKQEHRERHTKTELNGTRQSSQGESRPKRRIEWSGLAHEGMKLEERGCATKNNTNATMYVNLEGMACNRIS